MIQKISIVILLFLIMVGTSSAYQTNNDISDGIRPYQLNLTLHSGTGTNNATDVFLNGHGNSTFTGLYFKLDNSTSLNHCVVNSTTGKTFVNVTANGTVNLIYSDSPIDYSDCSNTFYRHDDFSADRGWSSTISTVDDSVEPWNDYPQIIQVENGSYLAAWNAGTSENSADGKIRMARSTDKGITWDTPIVVADTAGVADTLPFFIQDDNKTFLFYNRWYNYSYTEIMEINSTDNGSTWSSPRWIDFGISYNIPMANGIKLRNGKLIIPWGYMDSPWPDGTTFNAAAYSLDNGSTWTLGSAVPNSTGEQIDEPSIVELSNGTLYMTIRSNISGNIRYSTSTDDGATWSLSSLTSQVSSYCSPANVFRSSFTPNVIYLAANPSLPRNTLNLFISTDDTATWTHIDTVTSTHGEYPGIAVADGNLTVIYGDIDTQTTVFAKTYVESEVSGNFGENIWINNQGDWKIENGVLKQTSTAGFQSFLFLYQDFTELVNYTVHVDTYVPITFPEYGRDSITTEKDDSTDGGWITSGLMYTDKSKSVIHLPNIEWGTPAPIGYLPSIGTWYENDMLRQPNLQKFSWHNMSTPIVWQATATYAPRAKTIVGVGGGYDYEIWHDNFYVTRFDTPVPTWTTWGGETGDVSGITSWQNNKTSNNTLDFTINASEEVNFNATANQIITTWNWYKDDVDQSHNYDNITLNWSSTGLKHVVVNATNTNGTSSSITWNITVELIADTTAPTYNNSAHNTTEAGTSILFSIQYDDDTALHNNGQWIFSTNNTGSWVNESAVNWTATPEYANVSKTLNSTHGTVVGYRWYADDNAGNSNNTPIYTLTVQDTTAPIVTLLSQTPSTICQNCTGNISILYGISHSSSGLNNTSISFIYRDYDHDLSDSNHSIRPPINNLASEWNFDGRILRGANRNESLNFENNATITGGDTYSWSGLDENNSEMSIVPVNSSYTKVYINSTLHRVMPQMHYIDRSDLQEAPKTQMAIHKTQNVLVKFWNFEIFKGNTDFLGAGYTDTALNSNPALHPSDANPVSVYYISSGYDPSTGSDPLTSGFAVYMLSLNASEWIDHDYSPHANSSYVRGFIDNNLLELYINTTNISYLYYTSNTPSSKSFYINVTDVATNTNVSYANTSVLWAGDTVLSQQSYTPNIWFAFMKANLSFDHKLYVADNNNRWANSTMNRTTIEEALFPPTKSTFHSFHNGFTDYDMNGTYSGTFYVQIGAGSDPDGGNTTQNVSLHYGNGTHISTLANTTCTPDCLFMNVSFNSTPYYSTEYNYTMRVIGTDDEGETATTWLGVNFTLYVTPNITNLANTTGNFYVNYTWDDGSGAITDSYNVSLNSTWYNGSSQAWANNSTVSHGSIEIIVYAYNESFGLSAGYLTDNVTVPNNPVNLTGILDKTTTQGVNVTNVFNLTDYFTDTDNDVATFAVEANNDSTNLTVTIQADDTVDFNVTANWTGSALVTFNATDGYSSTDNDSMVFSIINVSANYDNFTFTNEAVSAATILQGHTSTVSIDINDSDGTISTVIVKIKDTNYTMTNTVSDTWSYTYTNTNFIGKHYITTFYAQDNSNDWNSTTSNLYINVLDSSGSGGGAAPHPTPTPTITPTAEPTPHVPLANITVLDIFSVITGDGLSMFKVNFGTDDPIYSKNMTYIGIKSCKVIDGDLLANCDVIDSQVRVDVHPSLKGFYNYHVGYVQLTDADNTIHEIPVEVVVLDTMGWAEVPRTQIDGLPYILFEKEPMTGDVIGVRLWWIFGLLGAGLYKFGRDKRKKAA